MPLPDDFFDTDTARVDDEFSIYPSFGEEQAEEKGSAYDYLGQVLWSAGHHFMSGATLGLTEFGAPTKSWEEKTSAERIGAAIGEATGFFVPMGLIGKGVRSTLALG